MVQVVPDVILSQSVGQLEAPKAATASSRVLNGILQSYSTSPAKLAIEQARWFDQWAKYGANKTEVLVEKALVNVGALFLENISGEGRVSTEVDPRLAYNTGKGLGRAAGVDHGTYKWMHGHARIPAKPPSLFLGFAEKLVSSGARLVRLYEGMGVSKDRIILRLPATWEAIQAAGELQKQGIATHLVLVYR
jgi:transaldolase